MDTNPDVEELITFLRSYLKNPSIYAYIDGHGRLTGFIAVDENGEIFSTYRTIGMQRTHNDLLRHNKNKEGIIIGLQNEVKAVQGSNRHLSQWLSILCILFAVALLFIAYIFYFYNKASFENRTNHDAITTISINKPLNIDYE
jgi:preprotein translocase subunit SecG